MEENVRKRNRREDVESSEKFVSEGRELCEVRR